MCDTDIVMDGIGLYGGRGEYTCKIKIYDLGIDGGGHEKDGTMLFEIEDVPYYCPARTIHNIFFPKSVNIIAGKWYLLWVKVSGPSSDCGSSGQSIVVGDDQVVFTFKSSKKSNNGTDINSGQIPSILYRVVAHDRKLPDIANKTETTCKISKQFINTISCESFENLVKLLNWAWNQFKTRTHESNEKLSSNDELLLNRYIYICQVCLRLLKKYINEIYPSESFKYNENDKNSSNKTNQNEISKFVDGKAAGGSSNVSVTTTTTTTGNSSQDPSTHLTQSQRKNNSEKINLAESIGNVRALLIQILCDDSWNVCSVKTSAMYFSVLDECNDTFVSCFNAFYPTSYLKWDCLCDLLSQMDKGVLHSRLLSGILAGLCDPTVNLKSTFSIMLPYSEQKSITSPSDNYGFPILQSSDSYHYPILVEQMTYRTQKEKVNMTYSNWNFKDILIRLLDIISRPIRLKIENVYSNTKLDFYSNEYLKKTNNFSLISNCCYLLSKILAEIVYQSCTADTDTTVISPYSLQSTGIRFKKCDFSKTWNTGNFGSDAICFTVDRPGIVLAGCCVYYGSGSYEYQLELLHDVSSNAFNFL
jgi:E3 ubiquitin-protein ligase MYCBP2